jgi:serine/threonine protein kinase
VSINDQQREALVSLLENRTDIEGRYTNLRRLENGSVGNFSALLSADDAVTGQRVALKFLLPMFDGGYREDSFSREATLLEEFAGQADIIKMVAGRSEFTEIMKAQQGGMVVPLRFHYFALELAETDVGTIILNEKWGPEENLLAFRAMCRGVQRLHSSEIAHRDLKPPNLPRRWPLAGATTCLPRRCAKRCTLRWQEYSCEKET